MSIDRIVADIAKAEPIKADLAKSEIESLYALTFMQWSVRRVSLYDEEGVEGWTWTTHTGREVTEIGSWDDLPPWSKDCSAELRGLNCPASAKFNAMADFVENLLDKEKS